MSVTATPVDLGTFGVWSHPSAFTGDVAAEIERLGYGTIWVGGSPGADLTSAETVLAATSHIAVATGIVNIWSAEATQVAESYHRLERNHPGRFLLGIGAGHRETDGAAATKPFQELISYLDVLDRLGVPPDRRVLAALGPRMLQLAAERSAGAHPYLVTPEFTESARNAIGAAPLLAPEHKAALGTTHEQTLAAGREGLSIYLSLRMTNYLTNFRRMGFDDTASDDGGSAELVDALVAQGEPPTAAARLRAHLDAGADHVAIHPVPDTTGLLPTLTRLAPELIRTTGS